MTVAAAAVGGGAMLLGSFMSSRSAKKSSQAASQAAAQSAQVAREELAYRKQYDARANRIVDENNTRIRGRNRTADSFFDSLVRNVSSMDANQGVDEAMSEIEGRRGGQRRRLRSDLGGGLELTRGGALNLRTSRDRALVRNQITSQNNDRIRAATASLADPTSLMVPGAPSTGQASQALSGAFNAQAGIYNQSAQSSMNTANQFSGAAGYFLGQGLDAYQNRSRTPASPQLNTSPTGSPGAPNYFNPAYSSAYTPGR